MGLKYSQLPGLSVIPNPLTLDFLTWCQKVAAYRRSLATRTRTVIKYVDQGANSTPVSNSISTPQVCLTPKDLQDYIATLPADAAVLLRKGKRWRVTTALTTGISTLLAGQVAGSYEASAADADKPAPWIDGFLAPLGAGSWQDNVARGDAYSGVYSITLAYKPLMVRGGASADLESFLRTPYDRHLRGATLDNRKNNLNALNRRAFFVEDVGGGNFTLYVKPYLGGSGELANIECQVGTGKGINHNDLDDVWAMGITVTGFGLETDTSQNALLHCQGSGSNVQGFIDCNAWWGPHHVIEGYANIAGGVHHWEGIRYGLGIHDATGSTMHVNYNNAGGQEWFLWNCTVTHGAIQSENGYTEAGYGFPWFAHTSGGSAKQALAVVWGTTLEDHPTHKLGGISTMVNLPVPSDRRAFTEYRGFEVFTRCVGRVPCVTGGFDPAGQNYLIINSPHVVQGYVSAGQSQSGPGALTLATQFGVRFNSPVDCDLTLTGASDVGLINGSSAHSYDLVHSPIFLRGIANMAIDLDSPGPGLSAGCSAWNSPIVAITSATNKTGYPNLPNADARTAVDRGGYAGCAFYGCKKTNTGGFKHGYDAGGNCITLRNIPPLLGSLGIDGETLPVDLRIEYDLNGRPRNGDKTIGAAAAITSAASVRATRRDVSAMFT